MIALFKLYRSGTELPTDIGYYVCHFPPHSLANYEPAGRPTPPKILFFDGRKWETDQNSRLYNKDPIAWFPVPFLPYNLDEPQSCKVTPYVILQGDEIVTVECKSRKEGEPKIHVMVYTNWDDDKGDMVKARMQVDDGYDGVNLAVTGASFFMAKQELEYSLRKKQKLEEQETNDG